MSCNANSSEHASSHDDDLNLEFDEEENIEPCLAMDEVNQCSISNWYYLYDGKTNPQITPKRITILTKIIKLEDDFIEYLKQDGVVLPASVDTKKVVPNFESDSDEEREKYANSDEQDEENEVPEFTALQLQIADALDEFEEVFPKLNWSAPKDANWMLSESSLLRCKSIEDVFLVLKSSSFVTHDIQKAYNNCLDYKPENEIKRVLALRKWYDVNPSMEFRCFVKDRSLIGISQRDISNFYKFLVVDRESITEKLVTFWEKYIKNSFPLSQYTVDLYISRTGAVFIVDFNVFGPPTSPLLFNSFKSGHLSSDSKELVVNIVENNEGVMRPSCKMYSGVPSDFFSVENAQNLQEFIEKQQKLQQNEK
ncbi:hypothetical protein FDP41_007939 [Naegleria fowleri]|uniref:Cell division cycle protein 123 homolog n=1 Tax=Naegleria fowleri TaxID=5763 RepID=A0A6A5CBU3_NAEFO|nr:uncharacterized protein FDP41_007939 [Naegleria fowleri]KAF0984024.1 hypothetical protein FDP41_007939 [Naegleria fowleri]CAG4717686.1 unnamed protein product [Naegleria fowleri]